jgi:hypothetical protein
LRLRRLREGASDGRHAPTVQHALQLDDVRPFDLRERAVTETALCRVVDALHLAHRLGVFAYLDGERDVVVAAARIVGVGDADRRRLEVAPAAVAAFRLTGFEREDHTFGQRHAGAFGGLEHRRHGLDHFGPDHDVRLHGVVLPLAAARPGVVALAGVGGGAALHVDHAELT